MTGLLILLELFILIVTVSCNTNVSMIEEIVSNILPHCYYTHLKTDDEMDIAVVSPVTGIQIDLTTFDLALLQHLGTHQIIRNQPQCLTFVVNIPAAPVLKDKVTNFFSSPSFQYQAKMSYLIFYSNSAASSEFMLESAFENFPHRVFLTSADFAQEVELYQYCYYCFQGNPGVTKRRMTRKSVTLTSIFPAVTRQMQGRRLTFTAPPAPPLVYLVPSKKTGELEIVGMQEVILKSMSTTLNFTYTLREASQGLTGVQFHNGSWNGIMEEVLSGTADVGLSVATSYERNKAFDFTTPVFNAFLVLVSQKPSPFFNWEAIFYPFTHTSWLAILGCTILALLTYKILYTKAGQVVPENKKNSLNRKMSLFQTIYFTVGALVEQGYQAKVAAISSRVFISYWFFVAIVITCAYRSKLFLFLTFPIVEKPPSTFQQLAVSEYNWGLKSLGGVGLLYITQSPVAHVRYVGEKMEISTDKYSCLDRTVKEKFVCVIYRAYIDYMLELRYWNMKHKFYISDYLTPPVGSSWVLRKYSPLLPILDKFHAGQYEMGLAYKYIDIYQQGVAKEFRIQARNPKSKVDKFEPNINYVQEREESKPLRMVNLYGPFFILLFGLSLASLAMVTETVRATMNGT